MSDKAKEPSPEADRKSVQLDQSIVDWSKRLLSDKDRDAIRANDRRRVEAANSRLPVSPRSGLSSDIPSDEPRCQ